MTMSTGSLSKALAAVQLLVNRQGQTKGVFLLLAAWETVVAALEGAGDLAIARDHLSRRTEIRSLEEMELSPW